jgi:hypothetical protein
MVALYLYALSTSQNQPIIGEQAYLRQSLQRVVERMEALLPRVKDREIRFFDMIEVADSYEGLNDAKALRLLRQAWDFSVKYPKLGAREQERIASLVCAIMRLSYRAPLILRRIGVKFWPRRLRN